jgi:uncharacterized phage protein gp47/JayE
MTILTQGQFYEQMRDYMIANQDKITDLNEDSGLDTQLNAFATQLNQLMVKCSGGFKTQFEKIPFEVFSFPRESAETATGTLVFGRATVGAADRAIPSGTIVATPEGLLFETTEAGVITAGNLTSSPIAGAAQDVGSSYNVQIGEISVINTSIPDVNSVTNNIAFNGGRNRETNSEYFARFTHFILGLDGCNRYGIFTAAVTVSGIQSAYVEDHFPPESNLYNFTVYVDDGSGSVPSAKLQEVYEKIYGNDTEAFHGYSAAGINFRVLSAGLVPVAVLYTIEYDPYVLTEADAENLVEDAVQEYINSLWVGSDVIWAEVIRIVKGITGITDITALTLNASSSNVSVTASGVARVSTIGPTP